MGGQAESALLLSLAPGDFVPLCAPGPLRPDAHLPPKARSTPGGGGEDPVSLSLL